MSNNDIKRLESGAIDHTDEQTVKTLYQEEGLSMEQIAERSEITYSGMGYWFKKFDFETRDRLQAAIEANKKKLPSFKTRADGYECCTVANGCVIISRLLAVAEYGFDAVRDSDVHHKNGIRWDNRPENIEPLGTKEHRQKHGKLTKEDVIEIKRLLDESDMTHSEIADKFGVHDSTISNIRCGYSWDNVG